MKPAYKNNLRRRLVKKQGGKCPLCGRQLVHWKATLDHIIPRSRGGPGSPWNFQATHTECNTERGREILPGIDVQASLFERRIVPAAHLTPPTSP